MATRAAIDASITSRLDADHLLLGMAVRMDFDTDEIRVWTGVGELTINSLVYTGAGTLLSISDVEDTAELKSAGVSLTLSGMDQTVLSYALAENYLNRPITIYLVFTDGGSNDLAGAMTSFVGRMISMTITDDPNGSTVALQAENRLIDLSRPSNLRYTNASQQYISAGDTAFRYVAQMEDLEIVWGKEGTGGSAGLSNFNSNGSNKWF